MRKKPMHKRFSKCTKNHAPNETTKKALEMAKARNDLKQAATVEELFKQMDTLQPKA